MIYHRWIIKYFRIFLRTVWTETSSTPPSRPRSRSTKWKDWCPPPTPTSWTLSAEAATKPPWSSVTPKPSSPATTARTFSANPQGASANWPKDPPLKSKTENYDSNIPSSTTHPYPQKHLFYPPYSNITTLTSLTINKILFNNIFWSYCKKIW